MLFDCTAWVLKDKSHKKNQKNIVSDFAYLLTRSFWSVTEKIMRIGMWSCVRGFALFLVILVMNGMSTHVTFHVTTTNIYCLKSAGEAKSYPKLQNYGLNHWYFATKYIPVTVTSKYKCFCRFHAKCVSKTWVNSNRKQTFQQHARWR